MNKNVLFVDDERFILDGMKRSFHKMLSVHVAEGADEALQKIQTSGITFAAIVSDMRMPGMDGVEFLAKVKAISPDSVRIMLTGNTDQQTAIAAVNTGEVFRFVNKPCEPKELGQVVVQALRQYQLITAEKDVLEKTLKGSIEVLTEILALVQPSAFGKATRIKSKCTELANYIPNVMHWELDAAALLSQLGCVNLSTVILEKLIKAEPLTEQENVEFKRHPEKGAELIRKIPRLEQVAEIITYQYKGFDGSGLPFGGLKGDDIPLSARILHVVLEYDEKISSGWSEAATYEHMQLEAEKYDKVVLAALSKCAGENQQASTIRAGIDEFQDGMTVEEDIVTEQGVLLMCRGTKINPVCIERLNTLRENGVQIKPVLVTAG